MERTEDEYLAHYGIIRKSGRYPWGSGGNDARSENKRFLDYVTDLKKAGMKETDIAKGLGMTTTELRAQRSISRNEERQAQIGMAQRLKEKGLSNVAIGDRMSINESSVRSLLAPGRKDRNDVLMATSDMLKGQLETKAFIDIGAGVERHLGISQTKLNTAVAILVEKGYVVHTIDVPQLGVPGNYTKVKLLAPKGVTRGDIYKNLDQVSQISQVSEFSNDGGRSYLGLHDPISVNSKRLGITYAEQGGTEADGTIYVRPGVKDLSLGGSNYAQVRIAVDGTHYLKGMAVYKDDLPAGTDLVFNTNKSKTGNKLDALKPLKNDADNPFGAVIKRQIIEVDSKGKEKLTSAVNVVNEEGDWSKWSKNISSQMLSKQSPVLAKEQLNIKYETKRSELDEIMKLTNPAVKERLLESFADDADSAAIHLKAAAMPRQASHVILPIPSMKETEIYAPRYNDGESVVLVRYPHGGIFEIPQLKVNNRNREAKKILGNAPDAVGINAKVAERLSGADFDGDTVLVIPNNKGRIKTSPALEGLKNFDPKSAYPKYEGMKVMSASNLQKQMGVVSNLITDMTIRDASQGEIARAVRHSMVVIDSNKHELNYKQSFIDNGIKQLQQKYQGTADKKGGASTLISRARSSVRVDDRKLRPSSQGGPIDKKTGKLVYVNTDAGYTDKSGNYVKRQIKSTQLAEASDAHTLSSGTVVERVYADHSNKMKALANEARRVQVAVKKTPYSPTAKAVYSKEVIDLNHKLNVALKNSPLERQAQVLANTIVKIKKDAQPVMDRAEEKRLNGQALAEARTRLGAKKQSIDITDKEWSAIQAGAISNSKLTQILQNADIKVVKQLATPKTSILMPAPKAARAKRMLKLGYTLSEVANAIGVSVSTVERSVA